MQKIIITNKGLDFQKHVKEEEREQMFLKGYHNEKLRELETLKAELPSLEQKLSNLSASEKLFYNNTNAHFH